MFYRIKRSLGKDIGFFPQVDRVKTVGGSVTYRSHEDLLVICNDKSHIEQFDAVNRAKLTNVLSTGFLMPKFGLYSIYLFGKIIDYSIPNFCSWKTIVTHKNITHQYNIIYISNVQNEFIDFNLSKFVYKENNEVKDVFFNSNQDYLSLLEKTRTIGNIQVLSLIFKPDIPYDFFRINIGFLDTYIINEKIKVALEDDFTGVILENCENLIYRR